MLQSASTHMLPVGSSRPSAIRSFIRSHRSGIVVAHPGQVLGLGDHEPVVGVPVHEFEHGAEGACALADRLAEGPQPRRVQMGVPDDAHRDGHRGGLLGQQLDEHRLSRAPAVGDVGQVEQVARPLEAGAAGGRSAVRRRGARVSSSTRTRKSCQNSSNSGSRTCRSARCRVNRGAPSGSGRSSGHGLVPNGEGGLAAASTKSSTSSPPAAVGVTRYSRWLGDRPCTGRPSRHTRASAPNPVLPALPMAEAQCHLPPRPFGGDGAPDAEPGGVPGRSPRPADGKRSGSRPPTPRPAGIGSPCTW